MLTISELKRKSLEIRKPILYEGTPRLTVITKSNNKKRLKVILSGRGCSIPYCTMCPLPNYQSKLKDTIKYQLKKIFDYATESRPNEIVIYNDGSFFSDKEITEDERAYLAQLFNESTATKLVLESLPQFLSADKLKKFKSYFNRNVVIQVSLGLQTQNDEYRSWLLASSFNLNTFEKSVKLLQNIGYSTRSHILTPLPLLNIDESTDELIKTAMFLGSLNVDKISFCLLRPQKNTLVGQWYKNGVVQNPTPNIIREARRIGRKLLSVGQIKEFGFDGIDGFTCGPEELPWDLCDSCGTKIRDFAKGILSGKVILCSNCNEETKIKDQIINSLPKKNTARSEYALLKYV
ncbi:MAG: hypothetical protein GY739_14285 [Mesoflavibacter sp.]|nr:hypothetical protein [Mesoflavibacter sp.]